MITMRNLETESMGIWGSRRQLLLSGIASIAAPGTACAFIPDRKVQPVPASNPAGSILGQALPQELRSLLPGEAFQAVEFINSLVSLENSAKTLSLPPSKLSPGSGAIPTQLDRLYQFALPRLVALVDRAEKTNIGFADQAGSLLAILHKTQHVIPTLLSGLLQAAEARPASSPTPRLLMFTDVSNEPLALPEINLDIPDQQIPAIEPPPDQTVFTIKRSLKYPDLADDYAAMFKAATLRPEYQNAAQWHVAMMRQSRERYEDVGSRSGVPWYFIAAIHGLEASFNFRGHLHNGDFPLGRRTRQVPAGRPLVWLPPSDWAASALDALRLMGFAGQQDWSLARTLYRLEAYNGFGYRRIGRATPYLWSFSSLYDRGKYVADGSFNAQARSQQCGAALMIKLLSDAGDITLT